MTTTDASGPFISSRPTDPEQNIRTRWNLRPVINCSGNNTALGASCALPAVTEAVTAIMSEFVEITDLHRKANTVIASAFGTEAATVCNSVAAGISVSVAAAITGADLSSIEKLPETGGLANEVLIQSGHDVHFGQPIEQAVRLGGGRLVRVGVPTRTMPFQLEAAFTERTVAAIFVVSHHAVQHGNLPFVEFAEICHRHNIPVIVDLAAEQEYRKYHDLGADLTLHSVQKFLRGHTAGIIAGRKDLVRAAFLQNYGIGRCMKVGKEAIAGTIAAVDAWSQGIQSSGELHNAHYIDLWMERLAGQPGITLDVVAAPTIPDRRLLKVSVDPAAANLRAGELSSALARGTPPIFVSDHRVEEGWLLLNPYQLHPGEEVTVADAILDHLAQARAEATRDFDQATGYVATNFTGFDRLLNWPD